MRGLQRGKIKRNYFASLNCSVESAQFSKSLTRRSYRPAYGRRVHAEMRRNPAYGRRPLSPGVVGYLLNVYCGLPSARLCDSERIFHKTDQRLPVAICRRDAAFYGECRIAFSDTIMCGQCGPSFFLLNISNSDYSGFACVKGVSHEVFWNWPHVGNQIPEVGLNYVWSFKRQFI